MALMDALRPIAPTKADAGLIADGEAHRIHAQFGFAPVASAPIGMAQWIGLPPPRDAVSPEG